MLADIMMVGTGTGAVSMTLSALRSLTHGSDAGGTIIATDLGAHVSFHLALWITHKISDSAMPLLQKNISANDMLFRSTSARPQAMVLDWDQPSLPASLVGPSYAFDLIV